MKIINKYITCSIIGMAALASCKKDFLDNPSDNNPTLDTYYNNAEQVQKATGYLYNSVWYDYQDKAFHAIGETLGGNMLTETGSNYGSGSYNLFTVLSTDPLVSSCWQSLYKVAGTATVLINTFEQKKSKASEAGYLDQGIAEARFMRGAAYFTIARAFGDVPIVTDPVVIAAAGSHTVPRYIQKDVLQFALNDLRFAEENLPEVPAEKGRVCKYSAAGMMAKIYLYRKDYDSARLAALRVMNSGNYDLYPNYQEMFTSSEANNNIESLFALQWIAAGGYSFANPIQVYSSPSTLLKPVVNTGYSSVYPTLDMLKAYDPNDQRRKWSVMEHGFKRTDWVNKNFPGGFIYDTTGNVYEDATHFRNGSRSNALKYVVGPGSNGEEISDNGSSNICTYILRYADVLLIYAEAVLGNNASTADASALAAFNKVHNRANNFSGVPVTMLTKDIILHERRVEFAFEGDYWFDIQRQGFEKAKAIINAQERGILSGDGKSINHASAQFNSPSQLFLPIPQPETVSDPKLLEPPVPYY